MICNDTTVENAALSIFRLQAVQKNGLFTLEF